MNKISLLLSCILFITLTVHAQSFSSRSTGADGTLDLSTGDRVVQIPESGVLNYTTINIPVGRSLTFKRNSRNTPVLILAQGNVVIGGVIDVSAPSTSANPVTTPGPGGFYGGQSGMPGFGPGGGTMNDCNSSRHGRWIGPLSLVPLVGGSGAAGKGCCTVSFCDQGIAGGGGGAILIASSTSIAVTGAVNANGGTAGGPRGSGGAIRLVANSIAVSGQLQACGGNCGVIRLEAPLGSLTFTGSAFPAAVLSDINPTLFASAAPLLTISSIGGFPVPAYSGARTDTVDVLLPQQLPDPISVVVSAINIPVGTQVTVGFVSGSTQGTSTPGTLTGTLQNSTATLTISNLCRGCVTYVLATATFDPPSLASRLNKSGPDHVAKIKIEAAIGSQPTFVFLRKDGTVIDQARLPKAFLSQLGL